MLSSPSPPFLAKGVEMKLNLGCGKFPLKDFINLDCRNDLFEIFSAMGTYYDIRVWKYGDPLPFENDSVEAVTESHSLMYIKVEDYKYIFKEIHRVLKPGGIFRLTEDNCERSAEDLERDNLPWGNPASITGPQMMRKELQKVFTCTADVKENTTIWDDMSLCQNYHGGSPRTFFMETIKYKRRQ